MSHIMDTYGLDAERRADCARTDREMAAQDASAAVRRSRESACADAGSVAYPLRAWIEGGSAEATEMRETIAVRDAAMSITVPDLLSELHDAETALTVAITRGDAPLIGQIVLAVRHALANRVACRALYRDPIKLPTTAEAAAMAMYEGAA